MECLRLYSENPEHHQAMSTAMKEVAALNSRHLLAAASEGVQRATPG